MRPDLPPGLMQLTDIGFDFDGSQTVPVYIPAVNLMLWRPTFDWPGFPDGVGVRHLWTVTVGSPDSPTPVQINVLETDEEIAAEWARALSCRR